MIQGEIDDTTEALISNNYSQFDRERYEMKFFKKWAKPGLFLLYFHSFQMTNIAQILYMKKVQMVCLGLEPGAAGWQAQTNPLGYGGTPDEMKLETINHNF